MKTVSIIGVGRVGGAIALALSNAGYSILNLISRNLENANKIAKQINSDPIISKLTEIEKFDSDLVFITTQDSEIEKVVRELKDKQFHQKTHVFHTSGSLSSEVLESLNINCVVGSIHPLVSISDSNLGVKRFRDAYFCVEGDVEALEVAKGLVKDLGGNPFEIDTKFKSLYHASAVMACGHIVALIDASMEMLQTCGLASDSSKEILLPLIKSTIDNLAEQENPKALTGTFARADLETFERHLESISENTSQDILEIYLILGERSLRLAKQQNVDAEKIKKMSEKISLAKKNLKC